MAAMSTSLSSRRRRRIAPLTARENQILDLILRSLPSKHIAKQTGISPRTVEVHRRNILLKTQASSLLELAELCRAAGRAVPEAGIPTP